MTSKELEERLKAAEDDLKRLEKRVRVTEDIEEIKQLHQHYVNSLIRTEWDELVECFAENARVEVGAKFGLKPATGKAAIAKLFKEELAKVHVGKEGDFAVHPMISVDGDKAKGSWLFYMMYFYPRTGQSLYWVQGFHDMEYVRERGKWKISFMTFHYRLGLPDSGPPTGLT